MHDYCDAQSIKLTFNISIFPVEVPNEASHNKAFLTANSRRHRSSKCSPSPSPLVPITTQPPKIMTRLHHGGCGKGYDAYEGERALNRVSSVTVYSRWGSVVKAPGPLVLPFSILQAANDTQRMNIRKKIPFKRKAKRALRCTPAINFADSSSTRFCRARLGRQKETRCWTLSVGCRCPRVV